MRKVMAIVLAQRIELGQFDRGKALAFAREILYEAPQTLLGMSPRAPSKK
jgi:hypothetical protein